MATQHNGRQMKHIKPNFVRRNEVPKKNGGNKKSPQQGQNSPKSASTYTPSPSTVRAKCFSGGAGCRCVTCLIAKADEERAQRQRGTRRSDYW